MRVNTIGTIALGGAALSSLLAAVTGAAASRKAPAAAPPAAPKAAAPAVPKAAQLSADDFFETRVRPVLAESCYTCHGPERQMAGLRLDSREALLKAGERGAALVPGDPEKSPLIHAVRYTGKVKMPPAGKLPAPAIEALTAWVKMGAPWPAGSKPLAATTSSFTVTAAQKQHWAFQPVRKPAAPAVKNKAWPATSIDQFILRKLEQKGLRPNPPADKLTLLRRATFDLTGLPPTIAEIDAFLGDRSPLAFARVVDRLLASPRYGERWGRHWLDVARYADTKGYVFNEESRYPNAFTYRDYVIRAFNEDRPYNQFLIEQLAADRLVQSSVVSRQPSERTLQNATPTDQPATPATNDLRLTTSQRDLAAMGFLTIGRRFLNNQADIIDDRIDVLMRGTMGLTVSCARCHDHKFDPIPTKDYYSLYGIFASSNEPEPVIISPPSRNEPYFAHEKRLKETQEQVATLTERQIEQLQAGFRARVPDYLLATADLKGKPEETLEAEAAARGLNPLLLKRWRRSLADLPRPLRPIFQPWREFGADRQKTADNGAAGSTPTSNAVVTRIIGEKPASSRAELAQRYGALFAHVEKQWRDLLQAHQVARALAVEAGEKEPKRPEALPDKEEEAVRQALYGKESPLAIKEEELEPYFQAAERDRLKSLREKVARLRETMPPAPEYAMVLQDAKEPRNGRVFVRGNPRNPGEEVPRQFLQIVAGEKRQAYTDGSGRLELARAIASPDNPLTARVMANRVWMHHFGEGLVRTPGDFGMRSDPPTHPELLDYLATRFVEQGWSVKKLHRLIMLSRAYQMSSAIDPRGEKIDPENRLLWRMNRRRLELEPLRDSLLAVSGRLDYKIGGPAVEIANPPYTPRRTVYGFIDRQNLQNLFRTFDFASPDTTTAQRYETTIPQQALFMMNSPFVVEQARAVAARRDVLAYTDPPRRIRYLYRLLFGRLPTPDEVTLGLKFLNQAEQQAPPPASVAQAALLIPSSAGTTTIADSAKKDSKAGSSAEGSGSLSAWEQYIQVLLMSNEFAFVD